MQCYYLSLDNLVLLYNALASNSATSSSPFWARTWAIRRFSIRDVWMLSVTTFAVFIASSQASILSQALSFSTLDIAGQWSWSKKQSLENLHGLHLFLDGVHVANKRGPSVATLLKNIATKKVLAANQKLSYGAAALLVGCKSVVTGGSNNLYFI